MPENGVLTAGAVEAEREQWEEGKTVKERVYESAIVLHEPTTVSAVAERARCAPASARKHLEWFAEMRIVERVDDGQPARFRRNEAYFRWKRADSLRREHTVEELTDRLDALVERDRSYQECYGVADPGAVSAVEHAERGDLDVLESVWADVDDWLTVREDQRVVEQARRLRRERPSAPA
jgi:predicted ArsR family transcriptional regulator